MVLRSQATVAHRRTQGDSMNIPALIGMVIYLALGLAVAYGLCWVFGRALFSLINLF